MVAFINPGEQADLLAQNTYQHGVQKAVKVDYSLIYWKILLGEILRFANPRKLFLSTTAGMNVRLGQHSPTCVVKQSTSNVNPRASHVTNRASISDLKPPLPASSKK
ncbi:MAG: hypothetical protein ACRBBN_13470 [Methyloligellaceae bacterium]